MLLLYVCLLVVMYCLYLCDIFISTRKREREKLCWFSFWLEILPQYIWTFNVCCSFLSLSLTLSIPIWIYSTVTVWLWYIWILLLSLVLLLLSPVLRYDSSHIVHLLLKWMQLTRSTKKRLHTIAHILHIKMTTILNGWAVRECAQIVSFDSYFLVVVLRQNKQIKMLNSYQSMQYN